METIKTMSINVYDLIDKKVKYQLDKKDQLNKDLKEELYRVRVELAKQKDKCTSLARENDKMRTVEKLSSDVLENVKKRLERLDDVQEKMELISYYFDVILGLGNKYEVSRNLVDKSILKMIAYYFYVYNDYKDIVKSFLLEALPDKYRGHIYSADSIVVPQNASKETLIKLIEEQPYYSNGGHRDWNKYCFPTYPPYSEYMKNPFIMEEDVFKCLCDNVCKKTEGYEFLHITQYQKLTNSQIEKLGEGMLLRCQDMKVIGEFFSRNHDSLSTDFHRKVFKMIGYSSNQYHGAYILNYKDEIIKEILSGMNEDEFFELYNKTYGSKKKLFKMYFEIIKTKDKWE